jgi:hypothetical protein
MRIGYALLVSCCPIVVCEWAYEVSQRGYGVSRGCVGRSRRRTTRLSVGILVISSGRHRMTWSRVVVLVSRGRHRMTRLRVAILLP